LAEREIHQKKGVAFVQLLHFVRRFLGNLKFFERQLNKWISDFEKNDRKFFVKSVDYSKVNQRQMRPFAA